MWTVWEPWIIIYSINYVVGCIRPEMAMEFGFTKWNRYWMSGQSVDSPLFCFGTVKNSPGFVKLDQNRPCVMCMNCVEIVLAQVS